MPGYKSSPNHEIISFYEIIQGVDQSSYGDLHTEGAGDQPSLQPPGGHVPLDYHPSPQP